MSLALLMTGLVKGINLLTLLACFLLVLLLINLVLARRQLRHQSFRRAPSPLIFAATPALVVLEMHKSNRRPSLGLGIEEQVGTQRQCWFLTKVVGPGQVSLAWYLVLPRRGLYPWQPLHVCCTYPFGLLGWQWWPVAGGQAVVMPRLGQLHRGVLRRFLSQASPTAGQERGYPRQHPAAQTEFHGLRLFRPGDSPRWIHWRTSARRNEMMVREFEDMPSDNLILVVELWRPGDDSRADAPAGQLVETTLSLAATLCWEWCRQRGERFLLAVAGNQASIRSGVTGWDLSINLLQCLALQESSPQPAREALLSQLASQTWFAGSILLLTTCPDSTLGDNLHQLWHRPVACVNMATGPWADFFSLS